MQAGISPPNATFCRFGQLLLMAGIVCTPLNAKAAKASLTIEEALIKQFAQVGLLESLTQFGPPKGATGKKSDGSIWWAATNRESVLFRTGYNEPRRWLEARCKAESGLFVRSSWENIEQSQVAIVDPATGTPLNVTPEMLLRWGAVFSERRAFFDREKVPLGEGGKRQFFGLFSCSGSSGRPLWHVAIGLALESRYSSFSPKAEFSMASVMGTEPMAMISIRVVDAKLVKLTEQVFANEDKLKLNYEAELAAKENARSKAQKALQSSLAVGTETNCGLVLGVNGPLVEVQKPGSGTRVFVKRSVIDVPVGGLACSHN